VPGVGCCTCRWADIGGWLTMAAHPTWKSPRPEGLGCASPGTAPLTTERTNAHDRRQQQGTTDTDGDAQGARGRGQGHHAAEPGLKHPLTDRTIEDIRNCLGLIAARERELADAAGVAQERPYYTDDPAAQASRVVPITQISRRKPGDES